MPTRRIGDVPEPCRHPEHFPPTMMVWEPGVYEHTCPACGHKTMFTATKPICDGSKTWTYTGPVPQSTLKEQT